MRTLDKTHRLIFIHEKYNFFLNAIFQHLALFFPKSVLFRCDYNSISFLLLKLNILTQIVMQKEEPEQHLNLILMVIRTLSHLQG